ncbi:MAG: hypothetical protein CMF22_11975 [Idiomarinaceae bacterium]|nr:hypothetical protein [Idiomarinaceae bacterium]|tara:strand:+ start:18342 stop:18893 length:552 start_codon:yes stop_codon:yes gene_type:complete
MNVFYTDPSPVVAARNLCNIHVTKMIVESAQLLSAAHRMKDDGAYADRNDLYRLTHQGHPCAVWVCASSQHYLWVYEHLCELIRITEEASGKRHKTHDILAALRHVPAEIEYEGFTAPPMVIPEHLKKHAVFGGREEAYRQYLIEKYTEWMTRTDKRRMMVTFPCGIPEWYTGPHGKPDRSGQ